MLRPFNRLLAILIAIVLPWTGHAKDQMTTGGVQYSCTGNNTVTAYLTVKATGDVSILETITIKGKTYTTTRIGKAYPPKNDYLVSVDIPNTVKQIDKGAFRGCTNLSKIIIPDSPCQIDAGAFDGCKAISSVRTHTKGGQIDYLMAVIDKSNPCFTNNVVVYDEINTDTVYIANNIRDTIYIPRPGPKPNPILVYHEEEPEEVEEEEVEEDIDIDIPVVRSKNDKTFVLVIGNEHYKRLSEVPFAANDAKVFADYCEKTLGVPQNNIDYIADATQGDIRHGVATLTNRLRAFNGEGKAIVYYAGHGIPDEESKTAYLLPVDGFASDVESGYSLKKLCKTLGEVPSQQTLVFLDACFSGAERDGEIIASTRGVAIKVKNNTPPGNLLVFTASTGEETAICDKDRRHGVFTYYLLKGLRDSKGTANLGNLTDYVTDRVRKRSVIINDGKIQTPTVIPSSSLGHTWKEVKLR